MLLFEHKLNAVKQALEGQKLETVLAGQRKDKLSPSGRLVNFSPQQFLIFFTLFIIIGYLKGFELAWKLVYTLKVSNPLETVVAQQIQVCICCVNIKIREVPEP